MAVNWQNGGVSGSSGARGLTRSSAAPPQLAGDMHQVSTPIRGNTLYIITLKRELRYINLMSNYRQSYVRTVLGHVV